MEILFSLFLTKLLKKRDAEKMMKILGIDPGKEGAFVLLNGKEIEFELMPIESDGKEISFDGVQKILKKFDTVDHVFLERAMPLAMGAKHAFNYGRGFASLEIALKLSGLPRTFIEPQKWTKIMHEGISNDLKPKIKSVIAVERLFPQLLDKIPKSPKAKKMHDGVIDAILIAGYGFRMLNKDFNATLNDF